jgi:outer membrane protein assembly factor BamB
MRTRTRLLLFVLLPLVTAAGVVTWVSQRLAPAPTAARRTLPATTQVVSGRAGLAWRQGGLSGSWGTIGLIDPKTWYAVMMREFLPPAGPVNPFARLQLQLVAGDASGGVMHTGSTLKQVITGPGVESDGLLHVPTDASGVTAIDLMTQRPLWSADVGGPNARVTAAGGRLVACARDRITCLDATTGNKLWSVAGAGWITAKPALNDHFACYATPDALHVLDAATGRERHKLPATGLTGRIVVQGDRAYACGRAPGGERAVTVHAFDLDRGVLAWTHKELANPAMDAPLWPVEALGPAAGDGAIVFTVEDRLCAVDAATGERRWIWSVEPAAAAEAGDGKRQMPFDAWRLFGTPAVYDGVVYANWRGARVSGWDVMTGREVWRHEGPAAAERVPPPDIAPLAHDGLLLCVTADEGLCALKCDLVPKAPPPPSNLTPAAKPINLSWAIGTASTVLLVAIILAVFGLWRFMFSLASLLLCALTIWTWMRSYPAAEFVGYQQTLTNSRPFVAQTRRGVLSRDGSLSFGQTHDVWQSTIRRPLGGASTPANLWWTREPLARSANDVPVRSLLHFAWTHRSRPSGTSLGNQSETTLTLPHWLVAALLAIAPLAWLSGAWRDRRRYAAGLCPWCGYDLRESKGKCPECGRAIAAVRKR